MELVNNANEKHFRFDYVGDIRSAVLNNTRLTYNVTLPHKQHRDHSAVDWDSYLHSARMQLCNELIKKLKVEHFEDHYSGNVVFSFSVNYLTDSEKDILNKKVENAEEHSKLLIKEQKRLIDDLVQLKRRFEKIELAGFIKRFKYLFSANINDLIK